MKSKRLTRKELGQYQEDGYLVELQADTPHTFRLAPFQVLTLDRAPLP
jgi:hypothetical protein